MTQEFQTVIADTSFEARRIADSQFGEGQYKIIHEERFTEKSHLNIFKHEKVRLTISKNPVKPEPPLNESPAPWFGISSPKAPTSLREEAGPYAAKITPIPQLASNLYKKTQELRADRQVDGLRSLQEGDDEPKPQKIANNNQESIEKILAEAERIKDKRGKETRDNILNSLDALTQQMAILMANTKDILNKPAIPQGLSDLEKELMKSETPSEIIEYVSRELRKKLPYEKLQSTHDTIVAALELFQHKINISSEFKLTKSDKPQVIVLMGPTGVGKTTTIAKLAAKFCLNAEKPIKSSILNIDFYKLGAKDQLQKYAEIFGIQMEDITDTASLEFALRNHKNDDLIIVDTAGRSQYALEELKELKGYLDRIPNSTKYLTVSVTSKYCDLLDITENFNTIGYDHIILTKADETRAIGPAMGMLLSTEKSLAYITHGQSVPEDYRVANHDFFEKMLFSDML